jgi:protein transport protein SEC23
MPFNLSCRYHNQPGYEGLFKLLQQPQEAANEVIACRFPVPRVIDADNVTVAGRSQSRFLLVKLNPSSTHASSSSAGEIIFTDDVSMEVFLEHLKTLSVQS